MLASNGNTRETSISTPAMGHDSAWRKAATVAIIAATLPRSSRGLDDIASTTDNVGEIDSASRKQNCNRETTRGGLCRRLRAARFRGIHPLRQPYEDSEPIILPTPILFWCTLFPSILFHGGPMMVDFPAPRPSRTIIGRFQDPKRSSKYHFHEKK